MLVRRRRFTHRRRGRADRSPSLATPSNEAAKALPIIENARQPPPTAGTQTMSPTSTSPTSPMPPTMQTLP